MLRLNTRAAFRFEAIPDRGQSAAQGKKLAKRDLHHTEGQHRLALSLQARHLLLLYQQAAHCSRNDHWSKQVCQDRPSCVVLERSHFLSLSAVEGQKHNEWLTEGRGCQSDHRVGEPVRKSVRGGQRCTVDRWSEVLYLLAVPDVLREWVWMWLHWRQIKRCKQSVRERFFLGCDLLGEIASGPG